MGKIENWFDFFKSNFEQNQMQKKEEKKVREFCEDNIKYINIRIHKTSS